MAYVLNVKVRILLTAIAVLVAPLAGAGGVRERETQPASEELPLWVVSIINGDYESLRTNSDEYIGVGIGATEEEARSAAAVDFAGSIGTTVSSEIREVATEDSAESSVRIEAEVSSQAVISGIRPQVYQDTSGTWYALYRITAEEYRQSLERWLETVEVMDEARRTSELERLREERFEMERQAELERTQQRAEELRRDARRRVAALEESYLSTRLQPRILDIPTAELPGENRSFALAGDFSDDFGEIYAAYGVTIIQFIALDAFGALVSEFEEPRVPGIGFGGKMRVINGAGVVTRTSVALGGRYIVDVENSPSAEEIESTGSVYLAGNVRVPALFHTTYFAYLGTDKVAGGAEWAPFWNGIEDALTLTAAFALDAGYAEYDALQSLSPELLVGLGFAPVDNASFELFFAVSEQSRFGVELEVAWDK